MGNANTAGRQETAAPAIELRGISKAFGPVQANKDISIRVMPGTIHGIIGENGAGKSTLMSILFGYYKADAGEIFISGQKTQIPDSQAAIAAGIGMVFQHFKLVQKFTVLENVILGAEDGALLNTSLRNARATLRQLAQEYELEVDPDAVIDDLTDATVFMGVPTHYRRLCATERLTPHVCASMRLFTCGSAPLSEAAFDEFATRTGHRICERYGMSETGITISNPYDGDRIAGGEERSGEHELHRLGDRSYQLAPAIGVGRHGDSFRGLRAGFRVRKSRRGRRFYIERR